MDSLSFKRFVKEKFEARTEYDKDDDRHPPLAAELVRRAQLRRGWRVLDLACGTGLVSFLAAAAVGSQGSVIGIDISPGMIEQAKAKLQNNDNISFVVEDLENCQYPDHSFDAILCSSAIFYVNMKKFSKTLHNWLKPGGILAYNAIEEPYSPLLTLMGKLLSERSHDTADPNKPLSQTHSEQANREILQQAGFKSIEISKTLGWFLEKPYPLEDYVKKSFQLVAVGFRPFFPALYDLPEAEMAALEHEFHAKATEIAHTMLNSDGLVEDRHNDLWIVSSAT